MEVLKDTHKITIEAILIANEKSAMESQESETLQLPRTSVSISVV